MKKLYLLIIFLAIVVIAQAQHIAVKDFYYAENDLTARTYGTSVEDQNGNLCALIKVETTEKGVWAFDVGMLGVRHQELQNTSHPAEIWVYVPFGVTWIAIQHEQLGKLSRYVFPCSIEKGCTYIMKLTTGKVTTVVKETVKQQYLTFKISPANAVLEVEGELWEVKSDGSATNFVDFGTYNYRVQAPNYHTEVGKVTVNDPENAHKVPVTLKPDFVKVTLQVDTDAEIWVNNEKKGVGSWTGLLGKGTYKIECKQLHHETSMISQEITSALDGQTITLLAPTPIYGSLSIESTPNYASVFIDGKPIGETPKFVKEILEGNHEIRLSKEGYKDYNETVTIAKDKRNQVIATLDSGSNDETFTVNGVSFTMKFVEGGSFWMGAQKTNQSEHNFDSEADGDESPIHSVTLSSYYMGETEVTQALWEAVMGSEPIYNGGWESKYGRGNDYPAYRISWNDIQEFIRKLNQKTGKNFRLPTEAEWEYAARGGNKSNGYKYSGSNTINSVAWYWNNGDKKTHIVKTKSPNELGLYDMTGNVWECCSDWYESDYYGKSPSSNPQGPSSGSYRVSRGGSGNDRARYCRVSLRDYRFLDSRRDDAGFRLCLPQ